MRSTPSFNIIHSNNIWQFEVFIQNYSFHYIDF